MPGSFLLRVSVPRFLAPCNIAQMQLLIRRLFLFPCHSFVCFSTFIASSKPSLLFFFLFTSPHMFLVPCFSGSVTLSNFSRSLLFALQILPFSLSSFFHVFSISSTLLIPLLVPFPWVLLAAPFPRFGGVVPALKPLFFSNFCFGFWLQLHVVFI